jgi:hypothetical protein
LSEANGYSPILCPNCGRQLGTLITHPGVVHAPTIVSAHHGRRWMSPAHDGLSIHCEGTRECDCPGVWEYRAASSLIQDLAK